MCMLIHIYVHMYTALSYLYCREGYFRNILHSLQVVADDERPYALVDLDDDHASSTTPQLVRGYVTFFLVDSFTL